MNFIRIFSITIKTFFILIVLNFLGCENQMTAPYDDEVSLPYDDEISLYKGSNNRPNDQSAYPQSGSWTVSYKENTGGYQGGNLNIPNGSSFQIENGSLTAPSYMPFGADVTITMEAELRKGGKELVFTFGPSGCQFSPAAEIWFDWTELRTTNPKLYYIESNGNYVEQTADYIDISNNRMMIKVDHFSRYAVGME